MNILMFLMICIPVVLSFILGRRFEANNIKMNLEKHGNVMVKTGDFKWIRIIGRYEEIN